MSLEFLTPGIWAITAAINTMGCSLFQRRSQALHSSSVRSMTKRRLALPLGAS